MNLQYWNSPGHIVTPSYKNNKKQQTRHPPPKRHFAAPTRTRSRAAAPEPKPHPFSRCSKNTPERFISHRLRPFSHNSPGGARWRQRAGEEFSGVGRVIDGEHSQVSSASFFLNSLHPNITLCFYVVWAEQTKRSKHKTKFIQLNEGRLSTFIGL